MVGYRTHGEPSVIRRSAELWPEGIEDVGGHMGFAPRFIPPYPFPGMPVMGGSAALPGGLGGTTDGFEALPDEFDLSFVRGDAFTVSFLFVGVCWTPEEPDPAPSIPWEQRYWAAEIRDPDNHPADPCWYYYGWIPAWGGLPCNEVRENWFQMTKVGEFTCTAEYQDVHINPLIFPTPASLSGTLVTLSLKSDETILYPGEYMWDLQSAETRNLFPTHPIDPPEPLPEHDYPVLGGVRTWKQGAVTVVADYTIKPEKV